MNSMCYWDKSISTIFLRWKKNKEFFETVDVVKNCQPSKNILSDPSHFTCRNTNLVYKKIAPRSYYNRSVNSKKIMRRLSKILPLNNGLMMTNNLIHWSLSLCFHFPGQDLLNVWLDLEHLVLILVEFYLVTRLVNLLRYKVDT